MSIFSKAAIVAVAAMLVWVLIRIGFLLVPDQAEEGLIQAFQLVPVVFSVVLEIWIVIRLSQATPRRTAPPASLLRAKPESGTQVS